MVMGMGNYTCSLCGTRFDTTSKQLPPGRSSRWSCAACGDDFCFDCRAEQGVAPAECDRAPAEAADDIGEYGLVTARDAAASPARPGGADTRSATPSAPIVRSGFACATPCALASREKALCRSRPAPP